MTEQCKDMKESQRMISARVKEAMLKDKEEKCCGACCWFQFEDTDGWGMCPHQRYDTNVMHCSDLCTTDQYVSEAQKRHYMAVLLQHNRWRRNDAVPNGCKAVDMKELGKAIEFAVKYMKTL